MNSLLPDNLFPVGLSAEQCSSTATAVYKAGVAEAIAGVDKAGSGVGHGVGPGVGSGVGSGVGPGVGSGVDGAVGSWRLADLTGGLGVDSWCFSKKATQVWYHEMQEKLCMAAEHNFQALNAENIVVRNIISTPETISGILSEARPDIVYMDPARRGEGGKKVFLIEECTPDVLTLKDIIFSHCRHILLKLSPMADITMACSRLGSTCREVHIVATGGECKELLIWMDREWSGEYEIVAVELPAGYPDVEPARFSFMSSEEKIATASTMPRNDVMTPLFLFEPGKALMKAGCYNLISERFGLPKLGRSTHYYITDDPSKAETLKQLGKIYEIIDCQPLDKRTMKAAGKEYPRAEVTARNIPMDTDTFRKKLGVSSGDDAHIFGLKSDSHGNLLLITRRR